MIDFAGQVAIVTGTASRGRAEAVEVSWRLRNQPRLRPAEPPPA